jgi:hypothetical protein
MKIQSTGAEIVQVGNQFNVMFNGSVVYSNRIRALAVNIGLDRDMLMSLSTTKSKSNVYYLMKAA